MIARNLTGWGCVAGLLFATAVGCAPEGAKMGRTGDEPQWRLAVMSYTFNRFPLLEAIDKTKACGAKYLETYAWQKIGHTYSDAQFNDQAPEAALDLVRRKLSDTGVRLTGYYSNTLGKSEADSRKVFEFCRKMNMEMIIAEPPADSMDLIDRLAGEYKVKVAIHNHPKSSKQPDYSNWDPAAVMKMLEGRSRWLGACADNGHWVRSGLDPVESIRKYDGRLISMHLKDVNKIGPDAHDVPYGTGVVDMKGILQEVRRQGVPCVFSIEYEQDVEDKMPDVKRCIRYFDKLEEGLGK